MSGDDTLLELLADWADCQYSGQSVPNTPLGVEVDQEIVCPATGTTDTRRPNTLPTQSKCHQLQRSCAFSPCCPIVPSVDRH